MATQTTRRSTTRRRTTAQRSAAARKSAATRRRRTARTTTQRAKAEATGLQAVAQQAQRAVLIPVGAALTARDSVIETVQPYTRPDTAQREVERLQRRVSVNLRKFERRGNTPPNPPDPQAKRTRPRAEPQPPHARTRV